MSDITADVRVEHPDVVLTKTVEHDRSATVKPVSDAGTDPESEAFLYHVESADLRRFEEGLRNDDTIRDYERVLEPRDGTAIYRFTYTDRAKTFSPAITAANGVALEMQNEDDAWIITVWMPDRKLLARLWDYAQQNDIDIELLRVNEYASIASGDSGLTSNQRQALLVALDAGYFEEPRDITLGELASELGISQPAASGLLRRGIRRLIVSNVADDE